MLQKTCVLVCVAAVLAFVSNANGATKKIDLKDVPAKVLDAVKSKAPDGKIISVSVEQEGDEIEFEFKVKLGDKTLEIEVEIDGDGNLEIEVEDDEDDDDDDDD